MKLTFSSLKFFLPLHLVMASVMMVNAQGVVPDDVERAALLAIYNNTDGANWVASQRWTIGRINSYPNPDSTLYGVGVSNGDIESLLFNSTGMNGSLPSELNNLTELYSIQIHYNYSLSGALPYLGGLKKLTSLDISYNGFAGAIPSWIGDVTGLEYLSLSNPMTGPIPSEISSLTNLTDLYLYNMNLSMAGAIPATFNNLDALQVLTLSNCSLQPASMPYGLSGLQSLQNLDLSYNPGLELPNGNFPDSVINWPSLPNLATIYLRGINLKKLPGQFDELRNLNYLDISNNDFSDSSIIRQIVDTLQQIHTLQTLFLSSCQIKNLPNNFDELASLKTLYITNDPDLEPSGCEVIGNLPVLQSLYIYNDGLTDLPKSLSQLTTLQTLYAVNNKLNPVPEVIKNIPDLQNLYLDGNGITSLPDWFGGGKMRSISQLALDNNLLTLPLPDSLSRLTNLQYLSMTQNKLQGVLPSYFAGFTKVYFLNLSYNEIESPLPDFSQWNDFIYVYLQHNNLTGAVPATLSNATVRKYYVDLSFNHFDTLVAYYPFPSLTLIVNNNRLDFANILKVARPIQQYIYIPQDTVVSLMGQPSTVTVSVGDTLNLVAAIDSGTTPANQYQWYKYVDGVHDIPVTQPSTNGSYLDSSFNASQAGEYYYKITNPAVPGLTLISPKVTVKVAPCRTDAVLNITYKQYVCAYIFNPPADSRNCKGAAYRWDFGDNSTSTAKSPIHGFKEPGTYTVSLSLSFKCGTTCQADTIIQKQVVYDPTQQTDLFKDSLIQVVTDVRTNILSTTASTFSDAWALSYGSTALANKNNFLNGTRGVWRNESAYAYKVPRSQSAKVDISQDGAFSMEQFNWQQGTNNIIPNWIKTNTMTQYSPYSYELENSDVLGIYSAALYDYGGHLPSANGVNMRNNEMAFTSFEYIDGNSSASGNWIMGSQPMPAYIVYPVNSGYGNMAVIEANADDLSNVQMVDVRAIAWGRSLLSLIQFSYQTNDSIVCDQQFLYQLNSKGRQRALVLKNAPFSGLWWGSIIVRHSVTPVVIPTIDNTIAHTGKSSLHITSIQTFKQELLHLDSAKEYFLNAWVSVNNPNVIIPKLSDNLGIDVVVRNKENAIDTVVSFQPSGPVIEGWQQVRGSFTCPINNAQLEITFKPGNGGQAWYDDLRLHPQLGNMKSYVYDLNDYHLTATLDEENFASFYYYDKEGNLYLVKKETEKGVKTISENVNYIIKK